MSGISRLIYCRSFGHGGRTVIFLHGFGGFGDIWNWQIKDLCSEARGIVPDLPGHGKSAWHGEGLEDMVEEIHAVMERERVDRAFLVASSFGGLVALKFWEKYPDRIRALSFIGSAPRFTVDADYPAGLDAEKIRKLAAQLKSDLPTSLDMFYRSLFTRSERDSLQYGLIKGLRRQAKLPDREALLAILDLLEKTDLRDVLGRVNVPVQFILGDSDYLCPLGLVKPLKAICPTAKFELVESVGHFPFLSRPEEVNVLLRGFIGL